MLKLRKALNSDLDFLVQVDSADEGVTLTEPLQKSKLDKRSIESKCRSLLLNGIMELSFTKRPLQKNR